MPRQPKIKRKGHAEFLAGIDLATTPYTQLVKLAKRAKLDSKGQSTEVLRAALNGQWRDSIQNNQHLNVFTPQRPGTATIERLHSRGRWEELKVKWPPLKVEILHDDD